MASDMGGFPWTGKGTAFPGNPSVGDRFLRTDRNLEYYYNGSMWLTTTLFYQPLTAYVALPTGRSATTSGLLAGCCFNSPTYDTWLENFIWTSYISGSSSGTLYWTVDLTKWNTGSTTVVSANTGTTPDPSSEYVNHITPINALAGTSHPTFRVDVTKVSTPGNLDLPQCLVTGRLVG